MTYRHSTSGGTCCSPGKCPLHRSRGKAGGGSSPSGAGAPIYSIGMMPSSSTMESNKPLTQNAASADGGMDEPELVVVENASNSAPAGAMPQCTPPPLPIDDDDEVDGNESLMREEWKVLACVIDRIFFWLYLIVFIISIIAIFVKR